MELGLFQKQTTNLVMTNELKQAIALLQHSTIELARFIREQATENPLIELEESSTEVCFEDNYEPVSANKTTSTFNRENTFNPIDFTAADKCGLYDELLEQTAYLDVSTDEQNLLRYIILNLNEKGYLTMQASEIAKELDIDEQTINHAIGLLQEMEPVGVGSRNIKECLLIQAKVYYPDNRFVNQVIENHLDLVAEKKWTQVASILGISLKEVQNIADCIASLNPRPCANTVESRPDYLYPDVIINERNGSYFISLNEQPLPTIRLNKQYMNLGDKGDSATTQYIKENYQKFTWLLRSIEQRNSTIIKITEAIIRKQYDFMKNGFSHLHPMTLKDIAEEIDMHESTVSRATRNKVIQTPNGSYYIRRLFTSKLGKDNVNNASSAQIKLLLKQIINEENPKKPLSDQKLADYFSKHNGIKISRRTIAKYREELNILSSSKRKSIC
ncbi:RNA polymerase factor sigma-54 [Virgibacillus kekensis]|uniref:RNA polymerase factor sigma-54 n=1 Tax=Virgibacillus kekensis TaxID=202261 RepID=A0ABV9DIP7_9BACI